MPTPSGPDGRSDPGEPRSELLARLFETVHEGVYIGILSAGDTRTLAINAHLKAVLGWPSGVADSKIRPFDADRFVDPRARDAFLERLSQDGQVTDYLLRLRRADGSPVWVEVTVRADTIGGATRIEALVRDVSERRKLEGQTRDLYQQLLQAEKLAALGQTISGVAHELNNPLATILTWAERLAQRSVDEPTKRGLETILGESERAAKIVRSLLTFARKRQTTRSMIDLSQVVRETLGLRAYGQRVANITVEEALAPDLPPVFADAHQIQQVLLNLIINAEQAMLSANGRGTLIVRTRHDPDREAVLFEVADDGPGIPDEVQPKIFDPFFTTKEVGKGTGLGLTVVYAILQEHGGSIRVESRPGGGASFFVELPVSGQPLGSKRPPTAPLDLEALEGSSALVVEDEPALAAAVSEALTDAGMIVQRAADGEEALALVRGRTYDVIVCDLKMPRVDGMRFYRTIAAAAPELTRRVIFVTGDVAGTDAERFLEESGCRWLAKPFRLGDLLRAARDVLT